MSTEAAAGSKDVEPGTARGGPLRRGVDPPAALNVSPGSSTTSCVPLRKAFGGQVMGSIAMLRLLTLGTGSPVKTMRWEWLSSIHSTSSEPEPGSRSVTRARGARSARRDPSRQRPLSACVSPRFGSLSTRALGRVFPASAVTSWVGREARVLNLDHVAPAVGTGAVEVRERVFPRETAGRE
jgi:hypothetical protein